MGVFQNNLMGAAAAAASAGGNFYTHQIDNSCRFGVVNSYLTRAISGVTNNTQNTISFWVKRSKISGAAANSRQPVMGNSGGAGQLEFVDADTFRYASYGTLESNVQLFRDVSAWYHIHIYRSTSNGSGTIYVNGVQVSLTTNTAGSAGIFQNGQSLQIGASNDGSTVFDGYIADVYGIYDQNIAHTEFGELKNGVWIPKDAASAITFGSHDFHLKFESSSDLGNDSSGNNNDFTATNMSAHDQMLDTPTNNFPTFNPLTFNTVAEVKPVEGNCKIKGSDAVAKSGNPEQGQLCTMGVRSGKWYWEVKLSGGGATVGYRGWSIGISSTSDINFSMVPSAGPRAGRYDNGYSYSGYSGTGIYHNNSITSYGSVPENDDIIGMALDLSTPGSGSLTVYKNGSSLGVAVNGSIADAQWIPWVGLQGGLPSGYDATVNFGQDGTFAGLETAQGNSDANGYGNFYYSVPTGYLAMCSQNLTIVDEINPAETDDNYPQKLFNSLTYTASGGDSYTGLGFKPDLVWVKWRGGSQSNGLFDSSRGTSKVLNSDADNAEATSSGLTAFGTDGYTMGEYYNQNAREYVSWNWRANGGTTSTNSNGSISVTQQVDPSGGFSISTYSGTAGTPTIGHGLSSAPTFVIVKQTDGSNDWAVYCVGSGATKYGFLESTAGFGTDNMWGNTTPSSTLVYLGVYDQTHGSGNNYIAYCFADTEGYIKSGAYKGNGDADGTFVYTGFRPALVTTKRFDGGASAGSWLVHDDARNTYNVTDKILTWNDGQAEFSGSNDRIDILANGFKVRSSNAGINGSDNDYVYLAMARNPFKYATAK